MSMRILIVNDDGILAPGIRVLEKAARALSKDVWIVAPETEQSAASHSLTLHEPLRIRRISARRYAVDGTPTDCVYLAFNKILADCKPDLVLSGVNRGSNIGEDVTYSGTIAAAMEATLLGAPAIAFSQDYADAARVKWATAAKWVPKVVRESLKAGWPEGVLLNVNFPDIAPAAVRGLRVGKQGRHEAADMFEERVDPRGRTYYWVGMADRGNERGAAGTDLRALHEGYVAITPLHLDLTHRSSVTALRKSLG